MINDGGPAFPTWEQWRGFAKEQGMTLRDWFAGLAMQATMQAMIANVELANWAYSDVAYHAYAQADVILREREQKREQKQEEPA